MLTKTDRFLELIFPADDLKLLQRNETRRTISLSYCFSTTLHGIQWGVSVKMLFLIFFL